MEAPEKLYFGEDDKGVLGIYSDRESDNEVEYIRTDAFIKKTLEWIKNRAERFVVDASLFPFYDYKKAVEDFKDFIKGE